jgi:hypothetical protein
MQYTVGHTSVMGTPRTQYCPVCLATGCPRFKRKSVVEKENIYGFLPVNRARSLVLKLYIYYEWYLATLSCCPYHLEHFHVSCKLKDENSTEIDKL